jgi:hypothetical protein
VLSPAARRGVERIYTIRGGFGSLEPEVVALAAAIEEARGLVEPAAAIGAAPDDATLAAKADAIAARLADLEKRWPAADGDRLAAVRARCQEVLAKAAEIRAARDDAERTTASRALAETLAPHRRLPDWATDPETHPGFAIPDALVGPAVRIEEAAP